MIEDNVPICCVRVQEGKGRFSPTLMQNSLGPRKLRMVRQRLSHPLERRRGLCKRGPNGRHRLRHTRSQKTTELIRAESETMLELGLIPSSKKGWEDDYSKFAKDGWSDDSLKLEGWSIENDRWNKDWRNAKDGRRIEDDGGRWTAYLGDDARSRYVEKRWCGIHWYIEAYWVRTAEGREPKESAGLSEIEPPASKRLAFISHTRD